MGLKWGSSSEDGCHSYITLYDLHYVVHIKPSYGLFSRGLPEFILFDNMLYSILIRSKLIGYDQQGLFIK